jgi:hypothetical protein
VKKYVLKKILFHIIHTELWTSVVICKLSSRIVINIFIVFKTWQWYFSLVHCELKDTVHITSCSMALLSSYLVMFQENNVSESILKGSDDGVLYLKESCFWTLSIIYCFQKHDSFKCQWTLEGWSYNLHKLCCRKGPLLFFYK